MYNSGPVVSAQGFSSLDAEPDEVSIYLSIEARGASAQEAQALHADISDEVITNLVKLGLERSQIQQAYFTMYPEYEYSGRVQELKGYVASEQLAVETSDFSLVAGIVDASVDAGALIHSINFELSDEKQSEYKQQALEAAGKDAQAKAVATAAGVGKEVGPLVSVSTQEFYYPGPIAYYDKAVSSEGGISVQEAAQRIEPRDIEVTASLTVTYRLR
ncbi:SIMPL domain-containing protein [Candidatus Pacearchaeota archaeon]|nr:SIMPL domain-containing protein [Candidatus Pacearchaeota archaeon]